MTEEETNIKETNVSEFKNNKNINILVSDESGGEGRNFQFVDLIIHYRFALANISNRTENRAIGPTEKGGF